MGAKNKKKQSKSKVVEVAAPSPPPPTPKPVAPVVVKEWLRCSDLARMFNRSHQTMRRWLFEGLLPFRRLPGGVMEVKREAAEKFLQILPPRPGGASIKKEGKHAVDSKVLGEGAGATATGNGDGDGAGGGG